VINASKSNLIWERFVRSKVSLYLLNILLLSLLVIALLAGIPKVESQFYDYYYPDVTLNPSSPTTSENINTTVSFVFASYPPYVEEFGPLIQDGNTFSVNITIYVPAPWEAVLLIVHADSYTYNVGNLSEGEYEFEVNVHHIHYTEGMVYLGANVNLHVTRASIVVPDDYLTIQEAINAAYDGDTIFVRNGTYHENVVVNKTVSLIGENKGKTIIDGNGTGTVVDLTSQNVSLSNFTIINAGFQAPISGAILLNETVNCMVKDVATLDSDPCGITLINSNHNKILDSISSSNTWGLLLINSNENMIVENMISGNSYGIGLGGPEGSNNNLLADNTISDNTHHGIDIFGLDNQVSSNQILNNSNGVLLDMANVNLLVGNDISNNSQHGVYLIRDSKGNTIIENTIQFNSFGVFLRWDAGQNNTFYHNNIISNTIQILSSNSHNTWDNGCEGNYWSDYYGVDSDGDGIGDTPYVIDVGNQGNCPLMNPFWNLADINHDLHVNMSDVVLAISSYDFTPSDPNWNCHSDVAEPYGVVDIFDIVMICSNYGEEYTP